MRKGEKDREGDHRDRETRRERDGERGGDRGEREILKKLTNIINRYPIALPRRVAHL